VPTNDACFFNTSTNFSCVKMWGPASAHYFIAPIPHVTRVYRYQCPGQIWFLETTAWFFKRFKFRRTTGFGYVKTLKKLPGFKEEPVVIWLIQIVFVDHWLHIKNGYLIFLGIVIMNFKHCHDTQQGFVQFIIPAPQWSTSLVSHRSSQDSTKPSSRYLPPNW